jgi:hypothetical protein
MSGLENYIQIRSLLVRPQNVTGMYGEKQKASGRSLAREEVVAQPIMLLKNKNKKNNPARGLTGGRKREVSPRWFTAGLSRTQRGHAFLPLRHGNGEIPNLFIRAF